MARLIYLSLLLAAAIGPPLVSVTRLCLKEGIHDTVIFPQQWATACCFSNDGTSGSANLTNTQRILNMKELEDGRPYCCPITFTLPIQHVYLEVGADCEELHLSYIDFSKNQTAARVNTTEVHCRENCSEDSNCQYFTFNRRDKECFLMSASQIAEVQLNPLTVSGSLLEGNHSSTNGLHFYQAAKSWIDALEYCHGTRSSLVHITNQTVQEEVNSLLHSMIHSMPKGVWIGLERSIFGNDVPWRWTSGPKVESLQNWNSSFPVDEHNNHCGKIIWVEDKFKWLDASCHEELPFLCQDL